MNPIRKIDKNWLFFYIIFLGSITLVFVLLPKFNKADKSSWRLHPSHPYFFPVKIQQYSSRNIPCLFIEIEHKKAPLKIDLGYSGGIVLPNFILNELHHKSFFLSKTFQGFRGKAYQSNIYEIPEVKIGNMSLYQVKIEEINSEFENDAIFSMKMDKPKFEEIGRIGWKLFYHLNAFVDLRNSLLAFCDSIETLKEQGYPIEEFTQTPLLLDSGFIEFEAVTDAGPIRCMLDTGATWNLLNKDLEGGTDNHRVLNAMSEKEFQQANPENKDLMVFDSEEVYETSSFQIEGKEFGTVEFKKIKSPLGIEAVIGMDFLENNLVFIDFSKRKIYFNSLRSSHCRRRVRAPLD